MMHDAPFAFPNGLLPDLAWADLALPCLASFQQRFPAANKKELVRIIESAPSLVRMSGANGTLSIKVPRILL